MGKSPGRVGRFLLIGRKPLPLTPALSRWERETKRRAAPHTSFGTGHDVFTIDKEYLLLPIFPRGLGFDHAVGFFFALLLPQSNFSAHIICG